VAVNLDNLAALHQANENYARAERLYRRALMIKDGSSNRITPTSR
jgi:hypothetical protein